MTFKALRCDLKGNTNHFRVNTLGLYNSVNLPDEFVQFQ